MSAVTSIDAPITHEHADVREWKIPIVLAIFAVVALVLAFVAPVTGVTRFTLNESARDALQLPPVELPSGGAVIALALALAVLAGAVLVLVGRRVLDKVPAWVSVVFAVLFMTAFLTWAAAGKSLPIVGLLAGTVVLSVPLVFGALGGVITERVGVVNVAIEGQLLLGAFSAVVVASATKEALGGFAPVLGLIAAMVAGVLVSLVLAVFSIRYIVDQVIVGVVLNVLVTGLTSFLFSKVLSSNAETLNSSPGFADIPIPLLSDIPVLGPVLFRHTIIVYLLYIAVFLVWYGLFKTRWGLRVRAVGEHPTAADTVGIKVNATRFWNVALAGAVAGLGGAYYTLDAVSSFNKEMTNGAGFIALAAVIFGRWDPIRATLAGLLFGFATSLQNSLGVIQTPVPSEFLLMLPYVVTIVAVSGLVGVSRPPAASGKPYIKS